MVSKPDSTLIPVYGFETAKSNVGGKWRRRNFIKAVGYLPIVGLASGIFMLVKYAKANSQATSSYKAQWILRGTIHSLSLGFLLLIPDLILTGKSHPPSISDLPKDKKSEDQSGQVESSNKLQLKKPDPENSSSDQKPKVEASSNQHDKDVSPTKVKDARKITKVVKSDVSETTLSSNQNVQYIGSEVNLLNLNEIEAQLKKLPEGPIDALVIYGAKNIVFENNPGIPVARIGKLILINAEIKNALKPNRRNVNSSRSSIRKLANHLSNSLRRGTVDPKETTKNSLRRGTVDPKENTKNSLRRRSMDPKENVNLLSGLHGELVEANWMCGFPRESGQAQPPQIRQFKMPNLERALKIKQNKKQVLCICGADLKKNQTHKSTVN